MLLPFWVVFFWFSKCSTRFQWCSPIARPSCSLCTCFDFPLAMKHFICLNKIKKSPHLSLPKIKIQINWYILGSFNFWIILEEITWWNSTQTFQNEWTHHGSMAFLLSWIETVTSKVRLRFTYVACYVLLFIGKKVKKIPQTLFLEHMTSRGSLASSKARRKKTVPLRLLNSINYVIPSWMAFCISEKYLLPDKTIIF